MRDLGLSSFQLASGYLVGKFLQKALSGCSARYWDQGSWCRGPFVGSLVVQKGIKSVDSS